MSYREYRGSMQGQKLTALAGYTVRGNRGYVGVGIYGSTDTAMQRAVTDLLAQFRYVNS